MMKNRTTSKSVKSVRTFPVQEEDLGRLKIRRKGTKKHFGNQNFIILKKKIRFGCFSLLEKYSTVV